MRRNSVLFLGCFLGFILLIGLAISPVERSFAVTSQGNAVPARTVRTQTLKPADAATKARVIASYGRLPLRFEANQGQTDEKVGFLSRGHGHTLFLTGNEAVLSLRRPENKRELQEKNNHLYTKSGDEEENDSPSTVVRMAMTGSNSHSKMTGLEELPGKVNYLIGNDPDRWRTNVPTYKKVRYREVYPGIDLIYYGKQGRLEYDFVVKPGSDHRTIKLAFNDVDSLEIDSKGDLLLHTQGGPVRLKKPIIYQEIHGVISEIDGGYVLHDTQEVCFQVAEYDTSLPLVIDPILIFSTYLGGSGSTTESYDWSKSIAVDSSGCAYVTGSTYSSDFPTQNPFQSTHGGGQYDAFITKLEPSGATLSYSTYLGGEGSDHGYGIAVDASGCAYVTGNTLSTDFPTQNPLQSTYGGYSDAFVTKLSPSGDSLSYSTYLGGSFYDGRDYGESIAVDASGSAYVTGYTNAPDFPTQDPLYPNKWGTWDAFVTKLDPSGATLAYSTYLGGSDSDFGKSIAVDASGCAYVTGYTKSSDFPTKNPFQGTHGGGTANYDDAFITKLNPSGSSLSYSTYLGGEGSDRGYGIAVDSSGSAYVTGQTGSSDFPTKNPLQVECAEVDAFVTKLDPSGATLSYSTYLGGGGGDYGESIAVDLSGSAYVTGSTSAPDFPTQDPLYPNLWGTSDAFVTKFDPLGATLSYSTYLGGNRYERGYGIAVDASGCAYVTGYTHSSDFPTQNPFQAEYGGGESDAFITKISATTSPTFHFGYDSNSGYAGEPVNTSLGNYTYAHTDLLIAGRGLPLTFSRAYNSQDSYNGPFGYGWTHSYNIFLYAPDENTLTVKYGDGHEEPYSDNGDGTFSPRNGGIYSALIENPDTTYTLTDKTQRHYHFNNDGKLTSITDKNGNTVTLTYTVENLTEISGPDGRTLTLTYDGSNRVTQLTGPLGRTISYAYNVDGDLISCTDALGGTWLYEYDTDHRITQITDPNGNFLVGNVYTGARVTSQTNARGHATTFQYDTPDSGETTITYPLGKVTIHRHDPDYRLIRETDVLGNYIEYTYDANGNRTQVRDKNGNVTQFTYDDRGNVTGKTDALENETAITYDGNNNPLTRVDALGNATTFAYDGNGNLTSETDASGNTTEYTYNAFGQVLTITDANGHTTTFAFDGEGDLAQEKDPLNNATVYTYDAAGRRITATDPNGNTSIYANDENDNLISAKDPLGNTATSTYDANNNKTAVTDRNENTIAYAYDENDNLESATDPLGNTTTYAYDALDRKTGVSDPMDNTTTYNYDTVGNLSGIVDALGNTTSYTYDGTGNRLTGTNPLGETTAYAYDILNRLISTTDALGNSATKAYDALGRVPTRTDANGNVTQYGYDALGRLAQVTEPNGGITSYGYDSVGNKISMTDARGMITTYAYDAANRMIQETDPLTNQKNYSYDGADNVTSIQKPDGSTISYTYDAANRRTQSSYPSGPATSSTYDANGNRTAMTDALGASSWTYDAMNRLSSYTDPFAKEVQYTYDANGNRTGMTYPGSHPVTYAYNTVNRLTGVTDWRGNTVTYQYDAAGNLISETLPNATSAAYTYDNASRLVTLSNKKPDASVINNYQYTLDGVGNNVMEAREEPFAPDFTPSHVDSSFGNDNRIETAGSATYTHDADGNRTGQTGSNAATFTYDYEDRLTAVSGSINTQYGYDGLGNRLSRTKDGVQGHYILDAGAALPNVIAETDAGGAVTAYYIHGIGLCYKLLPDGSIYAYHFDSRGSAIAMTDAAGQIANRYAYSPFGEVFSSSEETPNLFCFAGKYGIMEEGGGLKFMRARYYDAETGRFLNKDLIGGDQTIPQGLNRYAYASNNPIMHLDPSGLIPESTKAALVNSGNYTSDLGHADSLWTDKERNEIYRFNHLFNILRIPPIPIYGLYGGPGYTAGRFIGKKEKIYMMYRVKGIDPLDELFRQHDIGYYEANNNWYKTRVADYELYKGLKSMTDDDLGEYGRAYKNVAIEIFKEMSSPIRVGGGGAWGGETIMRSPLQDAPLTLQHTYDNLSRIVRVEYLDGSALLEYGYDEVGNRLLKKIDSDSDDDGLLDSLEDTTCTDPNDADTDDDGILDGDEDADHDGILGLADNETHPCQVDTDGDGIQDGTESGVTEGHPTDTNTGIFEPDLDPTTTTNPLDADTDDDGVLDGDEDADHDGILGLADNESHPCQVDTDGDGIQDGTELGYTSGDVGVDTNTGIFQPDLDPSTTTDPLNTDTDGDGLLDGEEDPNHNGRVDEGETDPNRRQGKVLPGVLLLLLGD